jgi:hypothetical protein
MSCYEWERGDIKLPAGAMKGVREAVVKAHNDVQERLLAVAEKILVRVKAENKGKRNVEWERVIDDAARTFSDEKDGFHSWNVVRLLMPERARPLPTTRDHLPKWERVKATRPGKPKRKDAKFLGKRVEVVGLTDATIRFGDDGRTVTWTVSENNHACDHARNDPIGRAFFSALGRVEWKRGSGGEIIGNDEYRRDDRSDGGGANYVKDRFGPAEAKKAAAGRSNYAMGWR